MSISTEILLTTLNARFTHASLGLRYLYANLEALQSRAHIEEFVLGTKPEAIVEKILSFKPRIVGFGVYIWNVVELSVVVSQLKTVRPDIKIVLGGPEVSFPTDFPDIVQWADHVITGQADVSFRRLAQQLLEGPRPLQKVVAGEGFELDELRLPYEYYSDNDLKHRNIYVEASRGCPFKCEFCLSSLDKTATPFDLDVFLVELEKLYQRGARTFKFVDRTFNLNIKASQKILGFFLDKLEAAPEDPVFAHFELVPDHLPTALRETIQKFPPGTLQFEIGIQTFNPEVQTLISRKQNDQKAEANIRWLVEQSHAHLHVDLIGGLPGESLESFGAGLDRLYGFGPHEIQLGVLKRLRGTPIIRHTETFGMRYNPHPPYNILATRDLDFTQVQRLNRLARYWDLVVNSGRFPRTLPVLLRDRPFGHFIAFADWLYAKSDATHQISMERLFDFLHEYLLEVLADPSNSKDEIENSLLADYQATKGKGKLRFMQKGLSIGNDKTNNRHETTTVGSEKQARSSTPKRQARFVNGVS